MNNKVDPTQRESFSELLEQLAKNSAAVVRHEIELFILRIREMVNDILSGFILILIGAVIIFSALICFCAALIIGLTYYMSPVIAAIVTGVAFALLGFVIAFIGYIKLKKFVRTSNTIQIPNGGGKNE
jgi:hypothetical protein